MDNVARRKRYERKMGEENNKRVQRKKKESGERKITEKGEGEIK